MDFDIITYALSKQYTDKKLNSGGTNIQSDWNQTNETAADYIKNKPFYSKIENGDYILPETTFIGEQGEGAEDIWCGIGLDFDGSLIRNNWDKPIKIILNGNEYEGFLKATNGGQTFKILKLESPRLDIHGYLDGDPNGIFIVEYGNNTTVIKYGEENTISIQVINENVTSIDAKYLPDTRGDWNENNSESLNYIKNRPFYETVENTIIIPQAEYVAELQGSMMTVMYNYFSFQFDPGLLNENIDFPTSVRIIINGKEYQSIFTPNQYVTLLNKDNYEIYITCDTYPWILGVLDYEQRSETYTFELQLMHTTEIKTIDKKFIPPLEGGDWEAGIINGEFENGYIKNKTHSYSVQNNYNITSSYYKVDSPPPTYSLYAPEFNAYQDFYNNYIIVNNDFRYKIKDVSYGYNIYNENNTLIAYIIRPGQPTEEVPYSETTYDNQGNQFGGTNSGLYLIIGITEEWDSQYNVTHIYSTYNIDSIKIISNIIPLSELFIPNTIARINDIPAYESGSLTLTTDSLTDATITSNYHRIGDMVTIDFFITGRPIIVASEDGTLPTGDDLNIAKIKLSGLLNNTNVAPLSDGRNWYAGGGHLQGYYPYYTEGNNIVNTTFTGWVLEPNDGTIYARGITQGGFAAYPLALDQNNNVLIYGGGSITYKYDSTR